MLFHTNKRSSAGVSTLTLTSPDATINAREYNAPIVLAFSSICRFSLPLPPPPPHSIRRPFRPTCVIRGTFSIVNVPRMKPRSITRNTIP